MKHIIVILIINLGLMACAKEDPRKCYKCYTNFTAQPKHVYDTCVQPGQRAWRDDGINCYED